jgi:hypothetical protein
MSLELSAPHPITFFISVIVAVVAVVIHYADTSIAYVHSGFVVLLVGYLILVAGNVLGGLLRLRFMRAPGPLWHI